jgi:hypothetical protein
LLLLGSFVSLLHPRFSLFSSGGGGAGCGVVAACDDSRWGTTLLPFLSLCFSPSSFFPPLFFMLFFPFLSLFFFSVLFFYPSFFTPPLSLGIYKGRRERATPPYPIALNG